MNGARVALGDYVPHAGVLPWFGQIWVAQEQLAVGFIARNASIQVHLNSAAIEHGFDIAHGGETALRENVHLHEPNGFD